MNIPIAPETLSPSAQKLLDSKTPDAVRKMAARGIAPGLRPAETLTVIALLAASDDEAIASAAKATLAKLPAPLLGGALRSGELPAGTIDALASFYVGDPATMQKILALPAIAPSTVVAVAAAASEAVAELVATNEEKLLRYPEIIEKLYMNKETRMSTADRLIELAVRNGIELRGIGAFKEAAEAIAKELIPEPSPEPTYDDVLFQLTAEIADKIELDAAVEDTHQLDETSGEEVVKGRFLPLHAKLGAMTISQKIRRAMLGTAAERLLLVRDTNRIVASAAIKSPMIQENEVVRISASRNVSQDVLRIIARDQQWARSHVIKLNLVTNPRTPFAFASKLIGHLREHELKAIAKSKNVTGAVATAAKQQLMRKNIDH